MATALCPGSFDPVTLGHLDIIERTSRHFDDVIVAVIRNPQKTQSLFSLEERQEMLKECTAHLSNIRIEFFKGLLVDFARDHGAERDREGPARRLRLRLRAPDGADEPATLRASTRSSSRRAPTTRSCLRAWSARSRVIGGDVSSMVPAHVAHRLAEMFPQQSDPPTNDSLQRGGPHDRERAREDPRHRRRCCSSCGSCSRARGTMPLSASVMVNREEFGELLDDAMEELPEELRQARWLLKERTEFLARAEHEAEQIIDVARVRAERMVERDRGRARGAPRLPRTRSTRPERARGADAARGRGLRRPQARRRSRSCSTARCSRSARAASACRSTPPSPRTSSAPKPTKPSTPSSTRTTRSRRPRLRPIRALRSRPPRADRRPGNSPDSALSRVPGFPRKIPLTC